jgi:hypothetical protein
LRVIEFAIIASSDYLHGVAEGETLPSLDERMQATCRDRFRRIDRFILLSVLGSAECAAKASLRADCGLYLSSGVGPVGSNMQVQQQLCRDHQHPKPFNFVNTLGSAAGHYAAKNLAMSGQNLFISRRKQAFSAALEIAATDLELGVVSQALVGAAEECALPLDEHRRRQGLQAEVMLAEGSHWILIERGRREDRPTLRLEKHAEPLDEVALPFHDSLEAARLTRWLERRDAPKFVVSKFTAQ